MQHLVLPKLGRLHALYTNSVYLLLNTVLTSLLGFAFWTLATRFYSTEDIGLNSAIIATVGYLALIGTVGLNFALIRFYPNAEDKGKFVNTYIMATAILGALAAIVFIAGMKLWTPVLAEWSGSVLFLVTIIAFVVLNTMSPIIEAALIANREAKYVLAKNMVFCGLKIGLAVVLVTFTASLGIAVSWCLALLAATLLSVLWLMPRAMGQYRIAPKLDTGLLRRTIGYSGGNYLSALLATAPVLLMPMLVVSVLGAEANAYFYIGWMVANLLFAVPSSVSYVLFSEGAANEVELRSNVTRALKLCFALLISGIAIVFLAGEWTLGIFGTEYATQSFPLLKVLAVSSIPLVFTYTLTSIYRVTKELKKLIAVWAIIAAGTIVGGYMLMQSVGIVGIGYAWAGSNLAVLPFQISAIRGLTDDKHSSKTSQ